MPADPSNPIPEDVVASFAETLSSSAAPGETGQSCDAEPQAPRWRPCDLETVELKVTRGVGKSGRKTSTFLLPTSSDCTPRSKRVQIACAPRPMFDTPSGATSPAGAPSGGMEADRKGAMLTLTANYMARCGAEHPLIEIRPSDPDGSICLPQTVRKTALSVEVFRTRNTIEKSRYFIGNGPVLDVARILWGVIDNEPHCGSVELLARSCGIRDAGPCVQDISYVVELHSEDELELKLKIPPLLGFSESRSRDVVKAKQGESTVGKDGRKGPDESGSERESKSKAQGLLWTSENSRTTTFDSGGKQTGEVTKQVNRGAASAYSSGYGEDGTYKVAKEQEGWDYLESRGFAFSLKHDGRELDLKGVKALIEGLGTIMRTISQVRALWDAGPGVEAVVGWSASWSLEFLVADFSAHWYRKLGDGAELFEFHRKLGATVTPISGSATASFGVKTKVQTLRMTWLDVDLSASLTLSGKITASLAWDATRKGDGEWSSPKRTKPIAGEIGLELKAAAKVTLVGRTVGTELAVDSGLEASGELQPDSAVALEKLAVNLKPVILKITVWVGSTGEPDYVFTQEIFEERPVYAFPPAAAA